MDETTMEDDIAKLMSTNIELRYEEARTFIQDVRDSNTIILFNNKHRTHQYTHYLERASIHDSECFFNMVKKYTWNNNTYTPVKKEHVVRCVPNPIYILNDV